MLKYVRNATSTDYILTGEINTPNGVTPITIRIISGGLYEIDTHIRYNNLNDAISKGDLVPLLEDQSVAPIESIEDPVVAVEPDEEEVPEKVVVYDVEKIPDEVPVNIETIPEDPVADSTGESFICPHCNAEFATKSGLTRHINKNHPEQ